MKAPLDTHGATGEKSAGEVPAPKSAEEQQVPVPAENVPEVTKVRAVSKKSASLKKPPLYQLKAPYRVDPDVRKQQRRVPARCVSEGPRTAGKSSSKGVVCRQGRTPRTAIGASDRELSAPAAPQKTAGLSRSALNEQQSVSIGDKVSPAGGRTSAAAGRQLPDAGNKSCGLLGESSKKEAPASEDELGRRPSPRRVTLQEKG